MKIVEETPYRFRIEQEGAMRVPGIVFASRSLLPRDEGDMALMQVVNVATLPGIVRASYAMPDVHWGYGFPIGGVAATDVDNDGVVSPGGVGFDISCGVRLLVGEGWTARSCNHGCRRSWTGLIARYRAEWARRVCGDYPTGTRCRRCSPVVPGLRWNRGMASR